MRSRIGSAQSGFSMVELMVAMVVTMMVSGAIYGLLAGGQTAFRREPELSDRQQNIRSAMDMIMRDIVNAGAGMPPFVQSFTQNLDACAGCPDGGAPMGPDGQRTDELEILTNPGLMESEPVCNAPGQANSIQIKLTRGTSSIPLNMSALIIMEDGTWTVREIVDTNASNGGDGACTAGDLHVGLNVNQGAGDSSGMNTPGGVCQPSANGLGNAGTGSCTVVQITFGEVVRYRIRNDANGVPVLQRFTTGNAAAGFQPVANGIEELQVQYLTQQNGSLVPPVYLDGAPAVVNTNYASLLTEVRVTLSARSEAGNLQGQTTAISARNAVRGRLVSAGAPRTALVSLTQATGAPLWR